MTNKEKIKEISKETKWLLDFANLGKKPGELDPPFESLSRLKKKPGLPPDADLSTLSLTNLERFGLPSRVEGFFINFPAKSSFRGDWVFNKKKDLIGRVYDVSMDQFSDFFRQSGGALEIDPEDILTFTDIDGKHLTWREITGQFGQEEMEKARGSFYLFISLLQRTLQNALTELININFQIPKTGLSSSLEFFLNLLNCQRTEDRPTISFHGRDIKFSYEKKPVNLVQVISSFFANFLFNPILLMRCPACGTFRFKETKRGRPPIFCTKECEEVFNASTTKRRNEIMKKYRDSLKEQEKNLLINFLVKECNYTQEEAEKEAKDWVFGKKKMRTLKQYKVIKGYKCCRLLNS